MGTRSILQDIDLYLEVQVKTDVSTSGRGIVGVECKKIRPKMEGYCNWADALTELLEEKSGKQPRAMTQLEQQLGKHSIMPNLFF